MINKNGINCIDRNDILLLRGVVMYCRERSVVHQFLSQCDRFDQVNSVVNDNGKLLNTLHDWLTRNVYQLNSNVGVVEFGNDVICNMVVRWLTDIRVCINKSDTMYPVVVRLIKQFTI